MSSSKRITLVTGATGFIGRRLCERLFHEGEYVRATGRTQQKGPWNEFVSLDLMKEQIPDTVMDNVKSVFHLASLAHAVSERSGEDSAYDAVIVEGTRKLITLCEKHSVKEFVYFSSVKAMGEGNPPDLPVTPIDESWPHTPQSPYGIAKAKAEATVRNSSIAHTVILRPVMVYGPGEKGNLPRMVNAIRDHCFPPLPDNGNKRSMIHVDDVIEYAIRSVQMPVAAGKTYLLASLKPVSTRKLYDAIRESLGYSPQNWSIPAFILRFCATIGTGVEKAINRRLPFDLETWKKLTDSSWYSSQLIQNELQYRPRFELVDWLENQPSSRS